MYPCTTIFIVWSCSVKYQGYHVWLYSAIWLGGRWQRWFYHSSELGLRLFTKSLIYSLLSIQVGFQLHNLVLHVLQQLHQLLYISRGLASHVDQYMHVN